MQFPITLTWACTVHKVQGLTENEIVVCFDLHKQNHVALSRARSLQGLHVIGHLENKHIRANPKVHAEYDRLRQEAGTPYTSSTKSDAQKLQVGLLNIRSLTKHSIDIKHDKSLTNCDVLALTETQLLPHHPDNTIRKTLHPYALHRQDHPSDKYSSLAICTKENINLLQKQYFPAINGLMFNAQNYCNSQRITFLLTYRKNNSNTTQYIEYIDNILRTNNIDIILGDFNINYFNEFSIIPLKHLMNTHGYIQIVEEATFISSGSLLDQVFVKQRLCNSVQNKVIPVYYSDHDAVKITIQ